MAQWVKAINSQINLWVENKKIATLTDGHRSWILTMERDTSVLKMKPRSLTTEEAVEWATGEVLQYLQEGILWMTQANQFLRDGVSVEPDTTSASTIQPDGQSSS